MEAICSLETSVVLQQTTQSYIPEYSTLPFKHNIIEIYIEIERYLVELHRTSQNHAHVTPGFVGHRFIISTYKLSACKQSAHTLLKLFMSGQLLLLLIQPLHSLTISSFILWSDFLYSWGQDNIMGVQLKYFSRVVVYQWVPDEPVVLKLVTESICLRNHLSLVGELGR
jgi:hypothetical protein